jgi:hypothetical protein
VRASTHVFATDLRDEGFATVLDTARDVAGLDGVTYAGIYHHARDILPHNPKRKVIFHEGGAAYFRPSADRFSNARIQPKLSSLVQEFDPLARLIDEADARDMTVRVWTNNLHNTALGSAYPDCTTVNAFGDHYITALCPANPDVRTYVRGMSAEIARYGVPALILESACYQPFPHGYHHERSHFEYSPSALFLLSLCFCEHCMAAARRIDVDVDHLIRYVRGELEAILEGLPSIVDTTPLEPSPISALAEGELGGYLQARRDVVSALLTETVDEVRRVGPTRVVFMDWSGGIVGYGTGDAVTGGVTSRAWQDGVDLAMISEVCDGIASIGYTRDPMTFQTDAAAYRALVPAGKEFSIAVRPMPPDCASVEDVVARVAAADSAGADWVEFYHYGLMRTQHIGWMGDALARSRE